MEDRHQEFWKKYGSELDQLEARRTEWYRHIILVASSLFGILVSFRPAPACIKSTSIVCFTLALTFLAFGILSLSVKLYGQIDTHSKALLKYHDEASKALLSNTPIPNVFISPKKIFMISGYVGYTCFISAIIFLSLYLWLLYI